MGDPWGVLDFLGKWLEISQDFRLRGQGRPGEAPRARVRAASARERGTGVRRVLRRAAHAAPLRYPRTL